MANNERLSRLFSEFSLTKIEACQVANRTSMPHDEMVSYVEYYRLHSDERARILENPFSDEVDKQIVQRFGNSNKWDILRAAIIAEPYGDYDRNYKRSSWQAKHEMLIGQIKSSARMAVRIQRYIEDNLSNIDYISDEELYKELCRVAFDSENETVIQARYALSQRRGFRLSIVNFLEDRNKLLPYKIEASNDPKAFAEKYLKEKFTGSVGIENLPIGIVIYLDEEDYGLIALRDENPESVLSNGMTLIYVLSDSGFPQELQGRIILLNKGGEKSGAKTRDQIESTKRHEIRHVIFRSFYAQQGDVYIPEIPGILKECLTKQDYQRFSDIMYGVFVERAREEIIAYFSNGRFNKDYLSFGLGEYHGYIRQVELALEKDVENRNLSNGQKKEILKSFSRNRRKCFYTVKRGRLIAEAMYNQLHASGVWRKIKIKIGLEKDNTSYQKDVAEALLRSTPSSKIHRLARYAGLDKKKIDEVIAEKDRKAIERISELLEVPRYDDQQWYKNSLLAIDQLRKQLPVESLPVILKAVAKLSEAGSASFLLVKAILFLLEEYIVIHGVNKPQKREIVEKMEIIIGMSTDFKDLEDSAKYARRVLNLIR